MGLVTHCTQTFGKVALLIHPVWDEGANQLQSWPNLSARSTSGGRVPAPELAGYFTAGSHTRWHCHLKCHRTFLLYSTYGRRTNSNIRSLVNYPCSAMKKGSGEKIKPVPQGVSLLAAATQPRVSWRRNQILLYVWGWNRNEKCTSYINTNAGHIVGDLGYRRMLSHYRPLKNARLRWCVDNKHIEWLWTHSLC